MERKITITAHTGCEGTAPNSLEAIKKGAAAGADIVEFDLNFTSGGLAVLCHDKPENENYVTVDEAFALVAQYEGLQVNVDCKSTAGLCNVLEAAKKYSIAHRIFYTGITAEDAPQAKRQTPEIPYYLNVAVKSSKKRDEAYIQSLVSQVKDSGAIGINLNYKNCTKELVEAFHSQGMPVSVWTVNSAFAMKKALKLGADNITTKKVSKLKKATDKYFKK